MSKNVIYLVDGHTLPKDHGTESFFDKKNYPLTEAELIRKVNQVVIDNFYNNFDAADYELKHINNDNTTSDYALSEKIRKINDDRPNYKTDIAIECHFNAHKDPKVSGWLIIIGKNNKLGEAFRKAETIEEIKNKGIYTPTKYYSESRNKSRYKIKLLSRDLGFISKVNISSAIIENCFCSSPEDMKWLYSNLDKNIEQLAYIIINGIKNFYTVKEDVDA